MFLRVQAYPCSRQESRALSFSEERVHWQIPMNEVNIICDVTTKDGMPLPSFALTMWVGSRLCSELFTVLVRFKTEVVSELKKTSVFRTDTKHPQHTELFNRTRISYSSEIVFTVCLYAKKIAIARASTCP